MKDKIRKVLEENTWQTLGMDKEPNTDQEKSYIAVRQLGISVATDKILEIIEKEYPTKFHDLSEQYPEEGSNEG